jgi:GT2 family glycosyltransferase
MKNCIGIVTVLYNGNDLLPDFFQSLSMQVNCEYKLYVIDNSLESSGAELSSELAKKYDISCRVIFNNSNVGIAKGNNQGIKLAFEDGCTHILLANNDLHFDDESLLRNMMAALYANSANAVVPKIYYYNDNKKIWCAGGYISKWRAVSPHYGDREIDVGQYDVEKPIEYAPTCFMLLEAAVFAKVGWMDEDYFVYYDDVDFISRFNKFGYKLIYTPRSSLEHKVSSSTGGGLSAFTLYNLYKNRMLYIRKNIKYPLCIVSYLYTCLSIVRSAVLVDSKKRLQLFKGVKDGLFMKMKKNSHIID